MTLNEAHERQRRELISLRAKVARLEKQLSNPALSDQTEALERHIRHLEQVNKTEARRHEEFKALLFTDQPNAVKTRAAAKGLLKTDKLFCSRL